MLAVGGHFSTLVCPQDLMIFEHLVRRVISPFRGSDRTSQCYETQIETLQKIQIVTKLVQIRLCCVTKLISKRYETQIESLRNNQKRYETHIHADLLCYETLIETLRNSNPSL